MDSFVQSDDALICFLVRDYCDEPVASEQDDKMKIFVMYIVRRLSFYIFTYERQIRICVLFQPGKH